MYGIGVGFPHLEQRSAHACDYAVMGENRIQQGNTGFHTGDAATNFVCASSATQTLPQCQNHWSRPIFDAAANPKLKIQGLVLSPAAKSLMQPQFENVLLPEFDAGGKKKLPQRHQ